MKKYIREMIDDLRKKNPSTNVADLTPPPEPPMPYDLENQILSKNPQERLKQFDFQAQQESELEAEES